MTGLNSKIKLFYHGGEYSAISVGLSAAATWTWAPALILSTDIAANKGLYGILSFIIPNILALLLFSIVGMKTKAAYIFKSNIFQLLYNFGFWFVDFFCVIIQVTAGANLIKITFGFSYNLSCFIIMGLCFLYSMKGGLHYSIKTDIWQQGLLIVLSAVLFFSFYTKNINITIKYGNFSLYDTIIYSLILFSGPIMTNQHWQRYDKNGYLWAGLFFAVPLFFLSAIGLLSNKTGSYVSLSLFPGAMSYILILAILSGLFSTLDSAFASVIWLFPAKETLNQARIRIIVLVLIASFIIFMNINLMSLWKMMGSVRIFFAAGIIWRIFCYQKLKDYFICQSILKIK